jgi:hypothetical protein
VGFEKGAIIPVIYDWKPQKVAAWVGSMQDLGNLKEPTVRATDVRRTIVGTLVNFQDPMESIKLGSPEE